MKKTLIAALLCAPMALASSVTELNSQIAGLITSTGYTAGDGYTLVLTLGSINSSTGSFLKLADDVYFVAQVGKYCGINSAGSNANMAWPDSSVSTTTDGDITTTSLALTAGDKNWISYDKNGSGHSEKSLSQATLTITQVGSDTTLTVDYDDSVASGLVNKVVWTGTTFDVNNFVFGSANAGTTLNSFTLIPATPEPATATLSLLALAGLASRRRRH